MLDILEELQLIVLLEGASQARIWVRSEGLFFGGFEIGVPY